MAKIATKSVDNTVKEDVSLSTIMERLNKLEKENEELKGKKTSFQKGKEINEDQRKFSYKMWGGIPVLNFESFRKDKTKDLLYKFRGDYISNHYLKLELANLKTENVEVNEFNAGFTRSEKLEGFHEDGKPIMLRDLKFGINKVMFKTEDWGTIIVDVKAIN